VALFVPFMWVGAPLSNLPCIAFGRSASFLLRFLLWVPLLPTRLAFPLGTLPCFHYDSSCGCPSCKLTLCCVWAPSLAQVVLKKLSRSQNFSLFSIRLIFFPSAPLCGPFRAFHVGGRTSFQLALHCVWALCLIFVTIPLVGAPLANSPCLAFGHPALFSLRFLMWPPLLPTHLALCLVSLPHFRYNSSCGIIQNSPIM
jgi:hypothetical protein